MKELQDYRKIPEMQWTKRKQLKPIDFVCILDQKQQEQSKGQSGVSPASALLIPNSSSV
jgi:hypothetical protein